MSCSTERKKQEREIERRMVLVRGMNLNAFIRLNPDKNGILAFCYYYVYYLYIFGGKRRQILRWKWAFDSHCIYASTEHPKSSLIANSTFPILHFFGLYFVAIFLSFSLMCAHKTCCNNGTWRNWMKRNSRKNVSTFLRRTHISMWIVTTIETRCPEKSCLAGIVGNYWFTRVLIFG